MEEQGGGNRVKKISTLTVHNINPMLAKSDGSESSLDRSATLMDKMKNKIKFNSQKVFNIIND